MSKQNNETKVLLLSLLITGAVFAGGLWWFLQSRGESGTNSDATADVTTTPENPDNITPDVNQRLSRGDRILLSDANSAAKQAGVDAIAEGNYSEAVNQLEQALKENRNDPEALIYLNNARIGNNAYHAIAVSVPISTSPNVAKEILRGVAQAQQELNQAGGINNTLLKVVIASDDDDPQIASQIATELAQNSDVLGVVGHFSSTTSLAAAKVYQEQGLTMISPTSTAVELSSMGNYIYRTVPSDRFAGSALAKYQLENLNLQKAAIFFNSDSDYSKSLKNVFTTDLFAQGGEVVAEYQFNAANFNAAQAVQEAQNRGAETLMLVPSANLNLALQVIQVNQGKLPLLAGDNLYNPQVLESGGTNAVGMVVAIPWHILANPDADFPKAASRLWGGEVSWRTAMAYDAAEALIGAIKSNSNRNGVKEALTSSNFQVSGASGNVSFLPSGDRNQAAQLVEVQPGSRTQFNYEFVPIEP
ncbi:MAG: ABC transporter substrate-binding protein [Jaaginema sp. PMC 1079.18]|nr:ABC transporter substrate-binding protein [Jaaginema sp. PMC 1080.18]MEC4852232.1 ABC transporter substrate-binding protein [Jaaginema sp. PMC 1079.18]MEC4867738.1 ABC transporter substrate-binding protein [Jaaginema sp. PMC 1078.18]